VEPTPYQELRGKAPSKGTAAFRSAPRARGRRSFRVSSEGWQEQSASTSQVTTKILESGVGAHPRYSGQEGGRGEKKYEQRRSEQLDRYYDDIISQLGLAEALLIFGPGEAKLELKERLSRSKALSECTVDIETADRLTEPQIVAKVKEHFGIVR
jgi:hypothetical protein